MISYRLAELRKAKGLTQQELADAIHVSRAACSQWETGRRRPEGDTMKRIADYFEVPIDYLEGRDEASAITIPEWVELFQEVRVKHLEAETTTLLRSAARLSREKLRYVLRLVDTIELQESDCRG